MKDLKVVNDLNNSGTYVITLDGEESKRQFVRIQVIPHDRKQRIVVLHKVDIIKMHGLDQLLDPALAFVIRVCRQKGYRRMICYPQHDDNLCITLKRAGFIPSKRNLDCWVLRL